MSVDDSRPQRLEAALLPASSSCTTAFWVCPDTGLGPEENLDRYLRLRVVSIGCRLEVGFDERKAKIGLLCSAARGWGCHRGVPKSIELRSGDGTTLWALNITALYCFHDWDELWLPAWAGSGFPVAMWALFSKDKPLHMLVGNRDEAAAIIVAAELIQLPSSDPRQRKQCETHA